MFGCMKHKQPVSFSIVKRPKPKILASTFRRLKHKHPGNSSIIGRVDGFFLKMPVRLAAWARKMSGTRPHAPSVTSTKRARARARTRATESNIERERERDGSEHRGRKPLHSGHAENKKKHENKLYSEKTREGWNCRCQKHPAREVGTRSRQCRPLVPGRFAFPGT